MEDKYHVKLFFVFFIFIVIIVGGYILMIQSSKASRKKEIINNTVEEEIDIRADKNSEYIYYSDEEVITEELDINFVNVNINFNDVNNISSKLNEKKDNLKKEIKYDKNNKELPYDGLTYVKYPLYKDYTYKNYLSLVVNYFTYDNTNLVSYINSECYVFDKNSGKLYTTEELLDLFGLTEKDVKEKVKSFINDADLVNGEITLDTNASLELVNLNSLYIDKLGRLVISVLVKSSEKDYNEIINLS